MTVLLLFETPPVFLSPTASAIQWAIIALLSVLATWQFSGRRRFASVNDENKRLNTALTSVEATNAAYKEELDLRRASVEKLRKENEEKATLIGELQKQTDLRPLIEIIARMQEAQAGWIAEGRSRFEQASKQLDRIDKQQELKFEAILAEDKAHREAFEGTMRDLSDGFRDHLLEDKKFQLELAQHNSRTALVFDSIERRFSDIAVHIGLPKWSEARGDFAPPPSAPPV